MSMRIQEENSLVAIHNYIITNENFIQIFLEDHKFMSLIQQKAMFEADDQLRKGYGDLLFNLSWEITSLVKMEFFMKELNIFETIYKMLEDTEQIK